MSRRRYLSTDISLDTKVNRLASEGGDFAALFYTWLIPHAGDDGIVHGNPEELLYMVTPGRRDKTPEHVVAILSAMENLGLILWDRDAHTLAFPYEPFYKYQSYIKGNRRRAADDPHIRANGSGSPHGSENPRNSTQVHEEPRTTPQIAASFSLSPSFSFSCETRAREESVVERAESICPDFQVVTRKLMVAGAEDDVETVAQCIVDCPEEPHATIAHQIRSEKGGAWQSMTSAQRAGAFADKVTRIHRWRQIDASRHQPDTAPPEEKPDTIPDPAVVRRVQNAERYYAEKKRKANEARERAANYDS